MKIARSTHWRIPVSKIGKAHVNVYVARVRASVTGLFRIDVTMENVFVVRISRATHTACLSVKRKSARRVSDILILVRASSATEN